METSSTSGQTRGKLLLQQCKLLYLLWCHWCMPAALQRGRQSGSVPALAREEGQCIGIGSCQQGTDRVWCKQASIHLLCCSVAPLPGRKS